ncbi:MAG: peptidoglycan DD-metalloendopeptidase family protein [Candidatus Peregrinibacteria bacterium]|nr:peptidoglycan DD-metalloendopeptidase family protein [Candidatus Peregrinibacteria bacterium]
MKKAILIIVLIGIAGTGYFVVNKALPGLHAETEPVVEIEDTGPKRTEQNHTIGDSDTFTSIMEELGIEYAEALAIVDASSEIFDFTNVRVGKPIRVVYIDGVRNALEYEPNKEDIVSVDLTNDAYSTTISPIEYDVTIERGEATIEESMFLSGVEAGLSEVLILDLAETLAWEVDFATQVQTGDSFVVVYEKRTRNGEEAGVGKILTASFTNVGETVYAYLYHDSNGDEGYYDKDGNSLVRPFLKAPLSYNRISSGYTYARFHPTLQRTTTHLAIDYAAASGTPIKAVGNGTITAYGWNGGFGNYVDIRHNDTYQTQYAHLSAYAKGLGVGSRVNQGDVIGYVGSTGFSTGPHLHYQVKVHGELVNPLEVEFPKGEALSESDMPRFLEARAELDALRE